MRRQMGRALAAAGVVVGSTFVSGGTASASTAIDYDCPDFPNQSVAQVVFVEAGGLRGNDRFRLDRDGDLIACEDQFGGGSRDIEGLPPAEDLGFPLDGEKGSGNGNGTPVGGVDAGAGGTAGGDGPAVPLVVAGAALTAVGLGAARARRRRTDG